MIPQKPSKLNVWKAKLESIDLKFVILMPRETMIDFIYSFVNMFGIRRIIPYLSISSDD
jgi:hypothetical protein